MAAGTKPDIDEAVKAATKAFKELWGFKVPGTARGRLLYKLADLIEANAALLAAIETLDNG